MSTIAATPTSLPQSAAEQKQTSAVLASGWLLTWLAMNISILPINLYLKNKLHLGAEAVAFFILVIGFASYIKPIAGLFSDNLTLFGTRRKHYLLFGTLVGGLCWVLLAFLPKTYTVLLVMQTTTIAVFVVASTALGGLLVDTGKRNGSIGRLTSQRLAISNLVGLIAGPLGGYLATKAFGLTIGICAGCFFLLVPVVALFLHEPPAVAQAAPSWKAVGQQLKATFASRSLWWGLLMCCLLTIAPGFGTPLLFYQQDTLKLGEQFIGNLGMISGSCGLLAALLYSKLCPRLPLRRLLPLGIICSSVGTLFYLGYNSVLTALLIEGLAGFVGTLAVLPLWDLCGRATPHKNEALGYSLMMSVLNLTGALSNLMGSWLYEHLHWNFKNLVWLNAGTTALVLLIIPLLPAALMDRRDGDVADNL
ncbi:MFS transporter [Armatimonas sp.]|uniref:MFS transporter n=1 Tax=Armatimonas sp. TaxID=1872638 RepID=UPI00374CE31F